ncbi:UrcA family protein [Sphingopyxis sp.]|uniref:UrcA family protein n=1 Tax=Sphingopyxis sp. TaxID=1908224 RepID=UPI003D1473D5
MKKPLTQSLTLALVAVCLAVLPTTTQATDTATATVRIDVSALDLDSPDGMKAAQRRIDRAVHRSCRNDVEHLTVEARRAARQCRDTLRSLAEQKLRAQDRQKLAAQ